MVDLERSLDHWITEMRATNVALYERWMNNELMAGNYAVRNTKAGIEFVDGWAGYDTVDQPKGYHSSDNGAIHIHILRSLQIKGWKLCSYLWDRLKSSVGDLDPYYAFVACTRGIMGPPRRWKLDGKYLLTIIPRGHAWAIDGNVVNHWISQVGAVSHHGQKNAQDFERYFSKDFANDRTRSCQGIQRVTSVEPAKYIDAMISGHQGRLDGDFQAWSRQPYPVWDRAYMDCLKTLSCQPLDHDEGLHLELQKPAQSKIPFIRPSKAMLGKFKLCANEGAACDCRGLMKLAGEKEKEMVYIRAKGKTNCNLESFDGQDPAPGVQKKCYCAAE